MPHSTGSRTLDEILDGGFPAKRAVLATGGPGTGKSTLAMQFLQAGLRNDERCLYISTEQTTDEIRDSFASFDFELDREGLTVTTLHTKPGQTFKGDDELTLQTLTGDEIHEGIPVSFTNENIEKYLKRFGPADRVVLDSITALRPVVSDRRLFSRLTLDLIRLFTTTFDATTLFTAEREFEESTGLRYKTHGTIRMGREENGSEDHFYLKVEKMRGVAHDRREYEYEFTPQGVRVIPRLPPVAGEENDVELLETGVPGLDELCGGGLPKGGLNILKTDGRATIRAILTAMQTRAFTEDYAVAVVLPIELSADRLCAIVEREMGTVDSLLDDDRLFILDMIGEHDPIHENHIVFQNEEINFRKCVQQIYNRKGNRPLLGVIHAHSILETVDPDDLQRVRTRTQTNFVGSDDISLYVINPSLVTDTFTAYLEDSSRQVLSTFLDDRGLQYVELQKSPRGYLGSRRLVEYLDEPPHLRVQGESLTL